MNYILACLLAYVIGAIPLSREQKSLIQSDQSAFRTFRLPDILPVLALDICKGAIAVALAWLIGGAVCAHLAVIFVVLGEICPPFPTRYARSGWAVAAGALLVISPLLILISLIIYLLSLLLTRYFVWSTGLAIVAFVMGLIVFAVQFSVWLIVLCVAGMLAIHRPKYRWQRKSWGLPRWRRKR